MKAFKLFSDSNNAFYAFEIENAYIRPKRISKLLENTVGVTSVTVTKLFHRSGDVRVNFKYNKIDFVVWEPFGDNSRYWVGPANEDDFEKVDITNLYSAFENYIPPLPCKIFGDIITLNFISIFNK